MKQVPDRKKLRLEYLRTRRRVKLIHSIGACIVALAFGVLIWMFCIFIRPGSHGSNIVYVLSLSLALSLSWVVKFGRRMITVSKEEAEQLHYVPPVTVAALPADEILVRGSLEPATVQSDVLLRQVNICACTVLLLVMTFVACLLLPHRMASSSMPSSVPWPLPEPFKINSEDIAHGEKQVEQMVHDRQEMTRYVNPQSPIWSWCVRQFAGVSLGHRIYWNNGEPTLKNYGSVSYGPFKGKPAFIQVAKMHHGSDGTFQPVSCSELWYATVFELMNLSSDAQFMQLYEDACAGKLTKAEWIEKNTRIEYLTKLKSKQVYEHVWKATAVKIPGTAWEEDLPRTYEEWISRYVDHSSYPWDSWGKYYDDVIVPYRQDAQK